MKAECESIYVEFDGVQAVLRTDIPEIAEFVRESHAAMIVTSAPNCTASIDVMHHERGYTVGEFFYDVDAPPSSLFDEVRQKILQAFTIARRDLVWIHAGVVRKERGALLIVGESASGKSTLTTLLTQLGWLYMSDEAAPVEIETLCVFPYLRAPTWRADPGRHLIGSDRGELTRLSWHPPLDAVSPDPAPVGSLVFTNFKYAAETKLTRLRPGQAALQLTRGLFNLRDHPGPFIAGISKLASTRPAFEITFGDGQKGAKALDDVGQRLFDFAE